MINKVLGIWGAGGLGREVLELAKIINGRDKRWDGFVFIVDGAAVSEVNGAKVIEYEDAKKKFDGLEVIIGIGEPAVREEKFNLLKNDGIATPSLIHPDVHIPDTTKIGDRYTVRMLYFFQYNCEITKA